MTKRYVEPMKESVQQMWNDYRTATGLPPDTPMPTVWHFCDNQEDADECARLVHAGRKRATAPSLWGFHARGENVPTIGALDIVTTWSGDACAIIRTSEVVIQPFHAVPASFAQAEGEGDGSLTWWRRVHREYYARELAGTMYLPTDDMPVVCQTFEVVHLARDSSDI